MCVCTHVCKCSCTYATACMWRSEDNLKCWPSPSTLFETLSQLLCSPATSWLSSFSLAAGTLGIQLWTTVSIFTWVLGDLNSDPYACMATALVTDPSPGPSFRVFGWTFILSLDSEGLFCFCFCLHILCKTRGQIVSTDLVLNL